MKLAQLKLTAAALALTAGTAWAQTSVGTDVDTDLSGDVDATQTDNGLKPLGEGVIDAAESAADAAENAAEEIDQTATDIADDAQDTDLAADGAVDGTVSTDADVTADTEVNAETDTDVAVETEVDTEADVTADAAVQNNGDTSAQADMTNSFSGMVVSDLVGQEVIEANGENVGEIEYVIRDNDRLSAVIGVGGFLGLGEHTVAVPLEQISMTDENALRLNASTKAQLEAQAEIDESTVERLEENAPLDASY